MPMNVQPIPTLDPRINEIRPLTAEIVNKEILPHESKLWAARGGRATRGRAAQPRASCARRSSGR